MKRIPNWLTVLRMILVPVLVVLYYLGFPGWHYYAAGVFIFACITDLLDGMIARKFDCVSDFGKLIDPIADKLLVMSAMLVLMDCGVLEAWVVIILLAREFVISGFRLVAAGKGNVIAAGWMGKAKTLVQDVGIGLLLLADPLFMLTGIPFGNILMYISIVLSIGSMIEYMVKNMTSIKSVDEEKKNG